MQVTAWLLVAATWLVFQDQVVNVLCVPSTCESAYKDLTLYKNRFDFI